MGFRRNNPNDENTDKESESGRRSPFGGGGNSGFQRTPRDENERDVGGDRSERPRSSPFGGSTTPENSSPFGGGRPAGGSAFSRSGGDDKKDDTSGGRSPFGGSSSRPASGGSAFSRSGGDDKKDDDAGGRSPFGGSRPASGGSAFSRPAGDDKKDDTSGGRAPFGSRPAAGDDKKDDASGGRSPFGGGSSRPASGGSAFGRTGGDDKKDDAGGRAPFGSRPTGGDDKKDDTSGGRSPFGGGSSRPAAGGSTFGRSGGDDKKDDTSGGRSPFGGRSPAPADKKDDDSGGRSPFGGGSSRPAAGGSTFGRSGGDDKKDDTSGGRSPFGGRSPAPADKKDDTSGGRSPFRGGSSRPAAGRGDDKKDDTSGGRSPFGGRSPAPADKKDDASSGRSAFGGRSPAPADKKDDDSSGRTFGRSGTTSTAAPSSSPFGGRSTTPEKKTDDSAAKGAAAGVPALGRRRADEQVDDKADKKGKGRDKGKGGKAEQSKADDSAKGGRFGVRRGGQDKPVDAKAPPAKTSKPEPASSDKTAKSKTAAAASTDKRSSKSARELPTESRIPRNATPVFTVDRQLDILGAGLMAAALFMVAGLAQVTLSSTAAAQGFTADLDGWLAQLFGLGRLVLPIAAGVVGWRLVERHFGKVPDLDYFRVTGFILLYCALITTLHWWDLFFEGFPTVNAVPSHAALAEQSEALYQAGKGGGFLGHFFYIAIHSSLGDWGTEVVMGFAWFLGVFLAYDLSFEKIANQRVARRHEREARQAVVAVPQPALAAVAATVAATAPTVTTVVDDRKSKRKQKAADQQEAAGRQATQEPVTGRMKAPSNAPVTADTDGDQPKRAIAEEKVTGRTQVADNTPITADTDGDQAKRAKRNVFGRREKPDTISQDTAPASPTAPMPAAAEQPAQPSGRRLPNMGRRQGGAEEPAVSTPEAKAPAESPSGRRVAPDAAVPAAAATAEGIAGRRIAPDAAATPAPDSKTADSAAISGRRTAPDVAAPATTPATPDSAPVPDAQAAGRRGILGRSGRGQTPEATPETPAVDTDADKRSRFGSPLGGRRSTSTEAVPDSETPATTIPEQPAQPTGRRPVEEPAASTSGRRLFGRGPSDTAKTDNESITPVAAAIGGAAVLGAATAQAGTPEKPAEKADDKPATATTSEAPAIPGRRPTTESASPFGRRPSSDGDTTDAKAPTTPEVAPFARRPNEPAATGDTPPMRRPLSPTPESPAAEASGGRSPFGGGRRAPDAAPAAEKPAEDEPAPKSSDGERPSPFGRVAAAAGVAAILASDDATAKPAKLDNDELPEEDSADAARERRAAREAAPSPFGGSSSRPSPFGTPVARPESTSSDPASGDAVKRGMDAILQRPNPAAEASTADKAAAEQPRPTTPPSPFARSQGPTTEPADKAADDAPKAPSPFAPRSPFGPTSAPSEPAAIPAEPARPTGRFKPKDEDDNEPLFRPRTPSIQTAESAPVPPSPFGSATRPPSPAGGAATTQEDQPAASTTPEPAADTAVENVPATPARPAGLQFSPSVPRRTFRGLGANGEDEAGEDENETATAEEAVPSLASRFAKPEIVTDTEDTDHEDPSDAENLAVALPIAKSAPVPIKSAEDDEPSASAVAAVVEEIEEEEEAREEPEPARLPIPAERGRWKMPDYRETLEKGSQRQINQDELLHRARLIEDTLESFGAPARVVEVNTGPVITQFGVEPNYIEKRGGGRSRVKVSAIAGLDKDLALALAAKSIRIEAPVPGKGYVGIEVPNVNSDVVSLRDVMDSPQHAKLLGKSGLTISLGKRVDGGAVSADLTQMPHLLVAGATGSGKSVCVNAIIACLLLQNSPEDLQFIMVDPKRVELAGYNGIPHLVAPVVVDLERIVGVLKWVQREMDDRYKRFASVGARHILDYNAKIGPDKEKMPYLIVIIDELADLMMLAPDETEKLLARLAQMARATGIHLIISTQRPSVDVVTGLIKANFPARIAFAVAASVDSRVILDQPGADKLLGRGDMLYQAPDSPAPLRLQGVYVSDPEINRITQFWKSTQAIARQNNGEIPKPKMGVPLPDERRDLPSPSARSAPDAPGGGTVFTIKRDESSTPKPAKSAEEFWQEVDEVVDDIPDDDSPQNGDSDELYDEAVELVKQRRKASISMLQRHFRIGYTRAARLIDLMEAEGIVGPAESGAKPRDVLK